MYNQLYYLLEETGTLAPYFAYAASIAVAMVAAIVARQIFRFLLVKFFTKRTGKWAGVIVANKVFTWVANLALPIALSVVVTDIGRHEIFWRRVIAVLLVFIIMFLVDTIIRSVGDIYSLYEVSKTVPLRGMLQVLEIIVFIVGGIVLISIFVNRSPAALLGSLGAMTAIVTIVFKDAILGFVAGIQLAANDLVRVGDTIEMPQRNILGTVADISLVTVKVEAQDKTTIAIPAYTFVSEPFVNRRSMTETGGRRILRSFNIDARSVTSAGNLEEFRLYLTDYLRARADIRQDLTLLVRQLTPAEHGIPLEVFAFATMVDLVSYENIQSEIFEHIYTVLPEFGLRLYQRPGG